jgi:hypothetical protein
MNAGDATDVDQVDEEILTSTVSDEALEGVAGGVNGVAYTWGLAGTCPTPDGASHVDAAFPRSLK